MLAGLLTILPNDTASPPLQEGFGFGLTHETLAQLGSPLVFCHALCLFHVLLCGNRFQFLSRAG